MGGARLGLGKASSRLGRLVCNSVVFTWAFVEMLVWFWVSGFVLQFSFKYGETLVKGHGRSS